MKVEIGLVGQDVSEKTILSLQDWLKKSEIEQLQVERKKTQPLEGQMGSGFEDYLLIFLGSATAVQLARSLHIWLRMRKSKISLKMKIGNDEFEANGENIEDENAFVEKFIKLARFVKSGK